MSNRWSEALDHQAEIRSQITTQAWTRWADHVNRVASEMTEHRSTALDTYEQNVTETMGRIAQTGVAYGDPYWWSPELCGVLEEVCPSMPDWTLHKSHILSPCGFMWFSRPIKAPGYVEGEDYRVRAITWCLTVATDNRVKDIPPSILESVARVDADVPPVRLAWSHDSFNRAYGVAVTYFYEGSCETKAAAARYVPQTCGHWRFGRGYAQTMEAGRVLWEQVGSDQRDSGELRMFGAAISLMNQRIISASPHPADRAARKRVERMGYAPEDVRVVTLRRRSEGGEIPDDGEHRDVAWSCRWVVSGHWRQQACGPNHSERKAIYLLPHIKGPEGLPLKWARRIYDVAR